MSGSRLSGAGIGGTLCHRLRVIDWVAAARPKERTLNTNGTPLVPRRSEADVTAPTAMTRMATLRISRLRARKRSAVAAYDEAAAVYRQTVLQGLQEVADTLSALDMDARTLQVRADAAGHARVGYGIARQQYLLGGISHLALLDAQRQLLQSEFDRVQAQADRYADTAALLHALGGGWRDD